MDKCRSTSTECQINILFKTVISSPVDATQFDTIKLSYMEYEKILFASKEYFVFSPIQNHDTVLLAQFHTHTHTKEKFAGFVHSLL